MLFYDHVVASRDASNFVFLSRFRFFSADFLRRTQKRGLNKRITKTYCPKNTLHRKQQQQLHFALKESEKCIIIICGEEIYVKKESKIFSKPGNYKMQKNAFSNCMMHQGEEKRTKETSADEPLAVVLGVNALIIVTAIGRDNIRRPIQQMQLRYRLRQRRSRCRCHGTPLIAYRLRFHKTPFAQTENKQSCIACFLYRCECVHGEYGKW